MWKQLELETGKTLIEQTGILEIERPNSDQDNMIDLDDEGDIMSA